MAFGNDCALKVRNQLRRGLFDAFVRRVVCNQGRKVTEINDRAWEKMIAYDWPGNVRELANAIERAVVLGTETTIEAKDLPSQFAGEALLPMADTLSYRDGVNAARKAL